MAQFLISIGLTLHPPPPPLPGLSYFMFFTAHIGLTFNPGYSYTDISQCKQCTLLITGLTFLAGLTFSRFSLYTNDYTSTDPSVKLLKFADDTTAIALIQDGGQFADRQEVEQLAVWCSNNNLELNTFQNCKDDSGLQEEPPCTPPTHHHEQSYSGSWEPPSLRN